MKGDEEPGLFHPSRRRFVLRKLHSLSGVLPVGVFLVLHLLTSARALTGEAAYTRGVDDLQPLSLTFFAEALVVLLPLLFHAGYGVVLAFEGRPNVGAYPYNRNWMYTAQRITGLLALVFIGWHLSTYWLDTLRGRLAPEQYYAALCRDLSTPTHGVPLVALAYVFGVGVTVFHFANGLYGFVFSWGIAVSRRAQRWSATAFGLAGALLFLLGANTAIYFATGSRLALFGSPVEMPIAGERSCVDIGDASWPSGRGVPEAPPPAAPPPAPVRAR